MFRKWVLFSCLSTFLLSSNDACTYKDCEVRREEREIPFFAPLRHFFRNIKNLFRIKSEVIEEKRKGVKSAFSNLLDEILRKKKVSDEMENDLRLGSYNLYSEYPQRTSFIDKPDMDAAQLIAAHGYLSESHTVLTEDGYMITMHRVLLDLDQKNKKVVMLHHGIFGSSEDWLLLGAHRALPYVLVENGFDVWLLNARGNRYSKMHTTKTASKSEFWDFSWHEMGVYDLPAEIKYISDITRSSELNFIGHSMGATALLVLLSTLPHYNIILKSGTLLAPLAYMYHAKGPIKMLANFYRENGPHSLDFLGHAEFMGNEELPNQMVERYCKGESRSCLNPLLLFGNGGSGTCEPKMMTDILAHVPAGGSMKTLIHYVQLVRNGHFQMFDYGDYNNYIRYGNGTAPLYNLRDISLPIAVFSSTSDWLATESDIQTLLTLLQDLSIHHVVKAENFGHFDFVWSPQAPDLIYNVVLSLLNQILPRRNSGSNDDC